MRVMYWVLDSVCSRDSKRISELPLIQLMVSSEIPLLEVLLQVVAFNVQYPLEHNNGGINFET